jgi:hypothetical protein
MLLLWGEAHERWRGCASIETARLAEKLAQG